MDGESMTRMMGSTVMLADRRYFTAIAEMAELGLRLERKSGTNAMRRLVERLRTMMLASDPEAASEETRQRAATLTKLLRASEDVGAEARRSAKTGFGGPTNQLWRRRDGNPIRRLVETGKIGALELAAFVEIQQVAEQQLAGGCLAVIDLTQPRVDVSPRPRTEPAGSIDVMPAFRRYSRWLSSCRAEGWPMEGMLEVILEGRGIREVERARGVKHGSLTKRIMDALTRYTILAGWDANTQGLDMLGP